MFTDFNGAMNYVYINIGDLCLLRSAGTSGKQGIKTSFFFRNYKKVGKFIKFGIFVFQFKIYFIALILKYQFF